MNSLLTTPNLIGIAVVAIALWMNFRKGAAATIESAATLQPGGQASPSISRAMDDLKHHHADLVIGQQLGVAQAAYLGSTLAGLAPKPPAPAPAAPALPGPPVAPTAAAAPHAGA